MARGLVFIAAWLLCSCISFKRTVDEPWVAAVDLRLPAAPLAGAHARVICGAGDYDEQAWAPASLRGCADIARILMGMGATVSFPEGSDVGALLPQDNKEPEENAADAADGESIEPDFTVTYIDRVQNRVYWSNCWWQILPLLPPLLWIIPCAADSPSTGELILADPFGIAVKKETFTIVIRTYYGLTLFPALLSKALINRREFSRRNRELSDAMVQHIKNVIYTFDVKRRKLILAAGVTP